MINPDSRLVQTAVIGSRGSGRAIILPTDADELRQWRRRHPGYTYWCGTQLGGCGNELSDRLYRDKVCHFAHRPNTSCHRIATGPDSADHLFIQDDLATWAGRLRVKGRTTLRNLGSRPGDAVDFHIGQAQARQRVRFQFSKLPHGEWKATGERLIRETSTLDWVFGPGTAQPETMDELYEAYGYLLRFRFETLGAVRRIRLRAEDPRSSTEWVPLDACSMTPAGLRVPGVRPRHSSGLRPTARAVAAQDTAPAPRSRDEQVAAVKEALLGAASMRTRRTWEELSRSAGSDLLGLSLADRVSLLTDVEKAAGGTDHPMLSALLRTGEGEPPSYLGDVIVTLGSSAPATAAVLKRWCEREAERSFAVFGVPPRKAPPRLTLTPDGQLVPPNSAPPQNRTIVHKQGGPVPRAPHRPHQNAGSNERIAQQWCAYLRYALLAARRNGKRSRAADLLDEAQSVLPQLPKPLRSQLRSEMTDVRRWVYKPEQPKQQNGRRAKTAM